jgi:hypothetical protein
MRKIKPAVTRYRDPLRRFTAAHLAAEFCIMGRRIRLETNSGTLFNRFTNLFKQAARSSFTLPDFLWRFIGERDSSLRPPWPEMRAFSDEGLRYVNLGQRSFFTIDLDAREAIGFLSEDLAADELGFSSVFAATLFDLMAAALGLVQVSAACVALAGKALLILGPPRSGKTTSTYLAGKLGLEFHSDEACFLDLQPDGLRAWGQFWPAAFREDSVQFLPELASSTRSFRYGDLTFLCFEKHPFQGPLGRAVTPIGCVFLERQVASVPQLIPLASSEREERLGDCLSLKDDERFAPQCARTLHAFGNVPAYRLPYGNDPGEAATFLRSILMIHNSLEATR